MRTAEQVHNTPTRLPVRERALVTPHALTPAEVDALIKVGEHLANISMRLTAMMEACGPSIVKPSRDLAESIIRFLDEVDPDPDLEPSLGWSVTGATTALDASPVLADLEEDIADQPHDPEQMEDWVQPVRLDVFPQPLFIGARP